MNKAQKREIKKKVKSIIEDKRIGSVRFISIGVKPEGNRYIDTIVEAVTVEDDTYQPPLTKAGNFRAYIQRIIDSAIILEVDQVFEDEGHPETFDQQNQFLWEGNNTKYKQEKRF
ncbi:MAG: hypothetical protein GY861_24250 [bacterium]|nr:hypothetical protein [bacterium]